MISCELICIHILILLNVIMILQIIEGSLEVQLPTIWRVEKAEQSSRVRR